MSSNDKSVTEQSPHNYGDEAVKLVQQGMKGINDYLKGAIGRGEYSRGTLVKQVAHKKGIPPLLTAKNLVKFRLLEGVHTPEEINGAIQVILEFNCGETGLRPALMSNQDGETEALVHN